MSRVLTSMEELKSIYYGGEQFIGDYEGPEGTFKVKNLKHGLFMARVQNGKVTGIQWGRSLPLIDSGLLKQIIQYFKTDLMVEACVRIFYDSMIGKYFFVKAGGIASGTHIYYDFSDCMEVACREGVYMICEIHSHNRMPAFFSIVDDHDELYHPAGLFGVIGRLQEEEPEILLRACMEGCSTEVLLNELFETSEE